MLANPKRNYYSINGFSICLIIFVIGLFSFQSFAQTKGLIVKPSTGLNGSGNLVLDPDGDGYISEKTNGVQLGFQADDEAESEIPFRPIEWENGEPLADLERGPNGGFSDFSYIGTNLHPVYTYTSADNNLMFRFRLGGIAPNSKGYSILIDTDNLFGNTGTSPDPNYTATNPGFEVEVVLGTNFGVYVFNVDGLSTTDIGDQVLFYPFASNAHKAVAWSTQGGNADYFYDFYVPFSDISAYFDGTPGKPTFNENTSIRMIANTVMSPHSVLKGPISDIGGLDDSEFNGNFANAWNFLVSGQVPTASTTTTTTPLPAVRSASPKVNSPIYAGATSVSGTSTEADGTTIEVFVNGSTVGTTTVSGGAWTITGLTALTTGQVVTATATAPGKSVSVLSTGVTVINAYTVCNTQIPVIDATNQNAKTVSGTVSNPTSQTITITLYIYTGSGSIGPFTTTTTGTTWTYDFCGTFGGSQFCTPCGTYYATAKIGTGCESAYSAPVCFSHNKCDTNTWPEDNAYPSTTTTTANPVISTTSLTAASTTISGTSASGATIRLYKSSPYAPNTYFLAGSTTAIGTNWSFTGQSLAQGQNIYVRAQANAQCISGNSNIVAVGAAALTPTTAPVVTSPIYNDETAVKGTSVEEAGTTITVRQNGTTIGTTTVDAYGGWSLTVASGTLIAGQAITATATATGKSVSGTSNSVTVLARPAAPAVPTVTGPLFEQGTSVSGTGPANTLINVYIDGSLLGTVTSDGSGNWTISGLSDVFYDLYAGGLVYATAGTIGSNESASSATVTVQCNPGNPAIDKTLTIADNEICSGETVSVTVGSSDTGVFYTLRNNANDADLSPAVLGTGGDITLTSFELTSSQTIKVNAQLAESSYCTATTQTASVDVTVNPLPAAGLTVSANSACTGDVADILIENSESGVEYQLYKKSDNAQIGSAVAGDGETITLTTDAITGSTTFYIIAINATTLCSDTLSSEPTVTVNCPAEYTVVASKTLDTYSNDESLATVTDPEGIASAALNSALPLGTALNTTTGEITVSDNTKLVAGTYIVKITTTDNLGSNTVHFVTLKFDPSATPLPVTLVKLTAKSDLGNVKVEWSTASEKDNNYFVVERGTVGNEFVEIGKVKGHGTTNESHTYSFIDENPLTGHNYYRLKQVDFDGQFELSRIVSVQFGSIYETVVYPNPAKQTATLTIKSLEKQNLQLNLVNMQGLLVQSFPVKTEAGANDILLQLDGISPGMYMIVLTGSHTNIYTKLIIE